MHLNDPFECIGEDLNPGQRHPPCKVLPGVLCATNYFELTDPSLISRLVRSKVTKTTQRGRRQLSCTSKHETTKFTIWKRRLNWACWNTSWCPIINLKVKLDEKLKTPTQVGAKSESVWWVPKINLKLCSAHMKHSSFIILTHVRPTFIKRNLHHVNSILGPRRCKG